MSVPHAKLISAEQFPQWQKGFYLQIWEDAVLRYISGASAAMVKHGANGEHAGQSAVACADVVLDAYKQRFGKELSEPWFGPVK